MPAGTGMGGAKIGEAYVDVGAQTGALQAGMVQAKRTFDKKAAAIESRAKTMATNLKAAWKTAAAGTAVLTAGVAKSVDMFMEFEDTQVELQKKLGASKDVISDLTSDLTDLSQQLPTTRQELTEIAAEAAKVGVSEENIVAYTKTMKMFEEATGMAADQAALFFGRINAISQAPITTVENLGSALAYLLDNFPVAEAEKITQVMLKMGRTVVGSMEASQQELAGLATAISSISERASRPATQLRRAFMEMGEKTAEYADMVKMDTEDLADSINDNAVDSFINWTKRFKELYGQSGMTVERIRQFADVSQAAAKGILPFVSNVGLMEDALKAAREEFEKNEALQLKYEMALTRLSTQLEITRGNIATTAQAFGGIFAPAVRDLNENILQPFTERLVYIMTQSEETREAIRSMVLSFIKVGGAITAIGLVVKALSMLVSPVFQIMALAGLLWAAWELNFGNIKGAVQETINKFNTFSDTVNNIAASAGLDFDFKPFEGGLRDEFEEQFPVKSDTADMANWAFRAAIGTAVWWGTGSISLGTITATIGVNIAFQIWENLKSDWQKAKQKWEKDPPWSNENWGETFTPPDWVKDIDWGWPGWGAVIDWAFSDFIEDSKEEWKIAKDVWKTIVNWPGWGAFYNWAFSDFVNSTKSEWQMVKGTWSNIVNWPGWNDILNPVNWLFFVHKVFMKNWVEWPGWPTVIGTIGWEFLDALTWGMVLPDEQPNWEKLAGNINWSWLNPLNWGKVLPENAPNWIGTLGSIPWGDLSLPDWDTLIPDWKEWGDFLPTDLSIDITFNPIVDKWNTVREWYNNLPITGGMSPLRKLPALPGDIEEKAGGGLIPGWGGGDKVPAMLERGEFVWNKEMVRDYGGIIKGLWENHRWGGPVGMQGGGEAKLTSGTGKTYAPSDYPALQRFNQIIDAAVNKMKPYVENTEKLTSWAESLKQIGYDTIVGFSQMDSEIGDLVNQQQELEDQYKGQTKITDSLISRLKSQYAAIDPSNIEGVKKFTDQIKGAVKDQKNYIDNLEALGLSTEEAKKQFNALKAWIKKSDMSWEDMTNSSSDASGGLDKLNDKLGLTSGTLESWAGTLMSSFSELASATGELSKAEQSRISGWTSAAQSALQGNWFQAAMDLFTGYMKGHIEELKARRKELEKKIDATHDMMIQGVQSVASEISSLASDYLGPFGGLVDDAAGSMDSFMKMTVAFTQGNTLDMVKAGFQGVLDIATGLISTFGKLIEDTKAHNALQERLEPLWDKIGEALSQLVWPLFAIVDWALDYLGIMQDMSDQASDIVEMNVPSGLKRNRLIYEAAATGPRAPSSGGGPEVPTWAEQIIAPLKNYLKPILDSVKDAGGLFQIMKDWVVSLAQRWGPVIVNKIPGLVDKIFRGINWLVQEIDWESIWNGIEAMAKFFLNNFPGALNEFAAKFDELLEGVYKEGGFLDQLEAINDNLKTLAKIMGGGAKILAGMAGGAAVGAALGGIPGAVIGGVIGAIGGAFFQEGGIAMGAMPAMVGEGGPEAIMPLDKLPQVMNLATASPGVGGSQAVELSIKIRNLFDGKVLNQRMTKAEQESKYKQTGNPGGHVGHGRNSR